MLTTGENIQQPSKRVLQSDIATGNPYFALQLCMHRTACVGQTGTHAHDILGARS